MRMPFHGWVPGYPRTRNIILLACLIAFVSSPLAPQQDTQAQEVQKSPILFYHESSRQKRIQALLDEFDFDDYTLRGVSEFDQMLLLKDWVYRRIPYDLNYKDAELLDAAEILRRAQKGESFICTSMAVLFVECAVSLGWTARLVFLRKKSGQEHAAADIWSNQYRKWIYIDPTWNIHLERYGVPLSVFEARKEWLTRKGRQLTYVFGAGDHRERYRAAQLPVSRGDSAIWRYLPLDTTWLEYTFQIGVVGRNDLLSCAASGCPLWERVYIIRDRCNRRDRNWFLAESGIPVPPRALFHDLNRVDITIQGGVPDRPRPVRVRFSHNGKNTFAPNFMEYLVKAGDGEWEVAEEEYRWKLKKGRNVLAVRIMNRFGMTGPITKKEIIIHTSRRGERSARFPRVK